MKILAMEKEMPNIPAEAFKPHLKAEALRVWELYRAETVRELYFRADRHEAVLMLECDSVEDAHTILGTLPLVEAGLITFDVIPLSPYPGFARLFAEENK